MNPLLKKQLQGSLFFMFVAAFGALILLLEFKRQIESRISNHFYMLEHNTLSYNYFNLETTFGDVYSFFIIVFCFLTFIYSIYLFYEEKSSCTGGFVAFIPVKKTSAYFYKWICGVLVITAAFAVVFFATMMLAAYFKPDIDAIYGYYNSMPEIDSIFFSFAGSVAYISLYILFMFFLCLLIFSFVLFALSAFGKIIYSGAFVFSVAVLAFAILFICSYFQYVPSYVIGAPENRPQFHLLQPVFHGVMSFYSTLTYLITLRINSYLIVFGSRMNSQPLADLRQITAANYFIGIVICAVCSGLFFLLGKRIYAGSEISRTDKVLMVNSLKIPAIIYACFFGFMVLSLLAVMGMDILFN